LRNLPLTFDYSAYIKSTGMIAQNFVAFSEYTNLKKYLCYIELLIWFHYSIVKDSNADLTVGH
jgi:hypothetical protein